MYGFKLIKMLTIIEMKNYDTKIKSKHSVIKIDQTNIARYLNQEGQEGYKFN